MASADITYYGIWPGRMLSVLEATMSDDFGMNILPDGSSRTEEFLKLSMSAQRRLLAFILTLTPNQTDAEDLLQETTMVMWRRFDEYRPGSDFVAWGITIARYKVLNYRKKYATSHVQFSDDVLDVLQAEAPEMLKELDSRTEIIRKCLRKLEEKDISLIRLRYGKGLTFQSISEQVGRSAQSIHKSIARIHNAIIFCVRRTSTPEQAT
jgi:RNA polymerase sigma-70 factor (ECF subfamily)